jgi:hypothetical protein
LGRRLEGVGVKVTWVKNLADLVNIARGQGWIFYFNVRGKHFYYVYAGTEAELTCISVEVKEPLKAKYVGIDEDGEICSSSRPIMPACARITEVLRDPQFEDLIK